jgi:integrase/recombinase XerD
MTTSTALTYPGKPASLPVPVLIGRVSDTWPPTGAVSPKVALLQALGQDEPEKLFERMHRERLRALQALAANTQQAYASDWRVFVRFCTAAGFRPLPASPAALEAYIEWSLPYCAEVPYQYVLPDSPRRNVRVSTVERGLAAVGAVHRWLQHPDPTQHPDVGHTLTLNARGRSHTTPKAPVPYAAVERALPTYGNTLKDLRAKALATLQWSAAVRRSELVAFEVEDLTLPADRTDGTIRVKRSKGDQAGTGDVRYVSAAARRWVSAWLAAARITAGPLFRRLNRFGQPALPRPGERPQSLHANQVALAWKDLARRAGYEPHEIVRIAGHSPRIGVAQALLEAGWGSERMVGVYTAESDALDGAMARWFRLRAHRTPQ